MKTHMGGLAASVASFVAVAMAIMAMLVGVDNVQAQGFTESFDTIGPSWTTVGSPGNFTSVYTGNGNNALFVSAGGGGVPGGAVHSVSGAGPGNWGVYLSILPSSSLSAPGALGYMSLDACFSNGQMASLALGTKDGSFGLITEDVNGNNSPFTPYTFTRGTGFYPMSISMADGMVNFSFDGINLGSVSGAGLTLTGVRIMAYGNVGGYVVDNLGVTAMAAPEPSTFALVGLGLAALVIFRRRK